MTQKNFRFTAISLCIFMAGVYVFQATTGFDPGYRALQSEWWKFFASVLGHSGPEHLYNNLFFLGLFGSVYEKLTDWKTFLFTFALSGVFANLTAFIFFQNSTIIGASGAAFGVLGALAVYRPNKIGLALGVPLPMWTVLIVYSITNLIGISASTNVAYEAHLFGMVSGAVIGYRLRETGSTDQEDENDEFDDWRNRIRKWEEKYML